MRYKCFRPDILGNESDLSRQFSAIRFWTDKLLEGWGTLSKQRRERMKAILEIHFYQEDKVSVFLKSDSSGDEEKFGEVLLFCLFAMRQMANLGQQGRSLAELLTIMPEGISDLGRETIGGVRLVKYHRYPPGQKRFEAKLDENRFTLNAIGFGLLARGVGYYAPVSVLALMSYLVKRRMGDDDYLARLARAAAACGSFMLAGKLTILNQTQLAFSCAISSWYGEEDSNTGDYSIDYFENIETNEKLPGLSHLVESPEDEQERIALTYPKYVNAIEAEATAPGENDGDISDETATTERPTPEVKSVMEVREAAVWDNWALGLGIACVFLGGGIGLLTVVTIVISILAMNKPPKPRPSAWKHWVGLVSGSLYFLVYMHNYGHL